VTLSQGVPPVYEKTASPTTVVLMDNQSSSTDDGSCRQQISDLLAILGARKTARLLGMHIQTVLAIAAGARVMPGSWALARERLAKLDRDAQ
jgi:hypothetical protein